MFAGIHPFAMIAAGTPTAGASGLIRALTIWCLLVPLALAAFVLAEIIQVDMVDAVNVLVYLLAAWLALALARLGTPGILDRALWLSLAVFCSIFVAMEFVSDRMFETGIGAGSPWLGDALCWLLTGFFIALILWRRPQARTAVAPVMALAAVGFTLHTLSLAVDIWEMPLRAGFGIDQLSFDNITDLIEFICLQLYLLAFIVLAAELSGQHALRNQIAQAEAAAENADTIRAAHLAFATATLTSHRFSKRRRQQAVLALGGSSGIGGWIGAFTYTRRLGRRVQHLSGKPLLQQFVEQLSLMRRYRLAPKYYYMFELWRPEQAAQAAHYLQRGETKGATYKLLRRQTDLDATLGDTPLVTTGEQRLSDKLAFHNRCRSLGLRTVPIYFAAVEGRPAPVFGAPAALPAADLFIKPCKGCGGNGASRWSYEAQPVAGYRGRDGQLRSADDLRAEIVAQSPQRDLIVQPRLVNHPDLADLNSGALATVRIVTCRDEMGGFEFACAAFRMARSSHSVVDNFHAGGIAAAVDITTGTLGAATDMGLSPQAAWFTAHPTTGATIEGRVLPSWESVQELVLEAHRHFDDFTVIGWDIAILADGPCIIEANGAPDLDIIQRTARRPLGNERLGRLMAWHLKRRLRPALLNAE
jgi:hypothetical protein